MVDSGPGWSSRVRPTLTPSGAVAVVSLIRAILYFAVFIFFIILIGRLVLDWIQVFARDWHPRGVILVIAEGIYSATDPALKLLRRLLPPLRIGQVQLDLAFIVLFLIVTVAMAVLKPR
jgi:YggT family protein